MSDGDWAALAIHQAPMNPECVRSASPGADCESASGDAPTGGTAVGFDDGAWLAATGSREIGIAMMAVGLLFQVLTLRQLKTARKGQTTQKGSGDAG